MGFHHNTSTALHSVNCHESDVAQYVKIHKAMKHTIEGRVEIIFK